MAHGQFSDICGLFRKLAKDHKGYGSAATVRKYQKIGQGAFQISLDSL
jgi:hypothetical protein